MLYSIKKHVQGENSGENMIKLEGRILQSERLTYRLLDSSDRGKLREILSDVSVTEPVGFMPADSTDKFDAFFADLTRNNAGVAVLRGETLIGYFHVNRYTPDLPEYREKRCVSSGFVIGKEYQNQGYATEALKTITDYLKRLFDYCIADCFAGNEPSKRVIEKCGYHYLETYTMFFENIGKEMTCLSYIY